MKLFIAFFACLLVFSANARVKLKDPLVITDSVTVSAKIAPDKMTSGLTVQYKDSDPSSVSVALEKAATIVKAHKDICTFDGYRVSPEYSYKDGKQNMEGYSGFLDFNCTFKDIKKFESVYNDVFALNANNTKYIISSDQVKWIVSPELYNAKKISLKSDAIKEAMNTVRNYSRTAGKVCYLKDIAIDFNDYIPSYRESKMLRATAAPLNVSEPDKVESSVSVTAKFSAACR